MRKTLFRIDDRLIHGQVLEGWVHNLNLTRIIIVSDRVQKDEDYKRMLEFSVPNEIKVDIFSIDEMTHKINSSYLETEDTILLFESTKDVLELIDSGIKIELLNVGCLHYDGKNSQLRSCVAVSDDDMENLKDINSMGTQIESRSLPQDKPLDIMELIRNCK